MSDPLPYNFKQSPAFRKMEEIACRLVLNNQDLNLISQTKVFKERATLALRGQQAEILKKYGLREVTHPQEATKYDLKVQLEKAREALEKENLRHETLTKKLEMSTMEFLDREVELNSLIILQGNLLE
jgi:hypothetical protein